MRHSRPPQWRRRIVAAALAALLVALPARRAAALILGGEGNTPIADPGWPAGAAALFNDKARVAWWEGPPFGGGQWVAEYRGDAGALSAILAGFARLDIKNKQVVVHDGAGHSVWLNPNREPAKEPRARIDWSLMVWQPDKWQTLGRLPADLNPTDPRDVAKGPPARIEVYAGGNARWADVKVPDDLEVVDQRLEAHGFTTADGTVFEGRVVALGTGKPLAARVQVQRLEPRARTGFHYAAAAGALADAHGRWVLKKVPTGRLRVVIDAEGYAPRVLGYGQFDGESGWHPYDGGLARAVAVSGRVTDDTGWPLDDVEVRLQDVVPETGGRYEAPGDYRFRTDADGRFRAESVPAGRATVWAHKPGYCRPGLGLPIKTPADDVALQMTKAAQVHVTVGFPGAQRPAGYIVQIEPEGGEAVGKYGGSANIDAKNQATFADVPPGRYVVHGQPNPGSADEQSPRVTVELKGGQTNELTLPAR